MGLKEVSALGADDKHKQILQQAVQAYYERHIKIKKEKLAELEDLNASLSEMERILASFADKCSSDVPTTDPGQAEAPKPEIEQSVPVPVLATDAVHSDSLKLASFKYDKNLMQQYKMIFFQELPEPDDRVVIEYSGAHYYTSKKLIMQIPPYPFPAGYFSKKNGWSSTVEQAFKTYRRYLGEQLEKQETDSSNGLSRLQKLKGLAVPSITKEDVLIDPFECDSDQGKKIEGYENCLVVELPDGRAMVQCNGAHYYTEKQKIMKLRYPVPKGYFDGVGLFPNAEISIRAYRHYLYLAAQTQTDQAPEIKVEDELPKNEKPRPGFFKEDSGFDYTSVAPQHIGGSTVYRSKAGKLVVKRQGKNNRGELLLTNDHDIEKLMEYDEKDLDWVIRSLSAEKRNILRGYLKDLRDLKAVTEARQ